MSIAAMQAVWGAPIRPTGLKLLALAMADMCNDSGESLHPSMRKLAARVGTSRSQTQRLVHALIDAGLLSVVANANGGKPGTTPRYRLHIDCLRRMHTGSADATGNTDATGSTDVTGSTDAAEGSRACTRGVAPTRQTGSTDATQSIKNHQITNREPSKTRASARFHPVASLAALGVPEDVARDFLALRKANRAPLTASAIAGIEREARKAGWAIADAIGECCARGWRSFKAEYVAAGSGRESRNGAEPAWRREQRELMAQLAGRAAGKPASPFTDFLDVETRDVAPRMD